MSEWNRRDRDEGQRRYGDEHRDRQDYGGGERQRGSARYDDEQRSFDRDGRGGDWRSYEAYQSGQRGYSDASPTGPYRSRGHRRPSGQSYGGGQYGGGRYDERDQDGLAYYGLGPFGSGQHPGGGRYGRGGQSGGGQYGGQDDGGRSSGARQGYGQAGAVGHNERLERVSDGEADHGHGIFGGGMMRGGEHRGRGPKNYTRSDDRIREDVNDRLSDDPWLDATEIDVAVSSCEVTLTGTVNSREDKRRAEDVVEQVSGVKHVQNNLRVQSQAGRSQTTATSAAEAQASTASSGGKPGAIQ